MIWQNYKVILKNPKKPMNGTHRFHTSISPSKSLDDYIKNGVCFGAFGSASILDYQIGKTMKFAKAQGNLSFGNVEGNTDLHIQLYDEDKKINPEVNLEVGGNASIGEAKGLLRIGTENFNVEGEVSGKAGVADVGIAALQGEAEGGFNFFGAKITVTGTGELGALGAGVEFSSKKGELEFGGKASFLAGIGLKVKVEY